MKDWSQARDFCSCSTLTRHLLITLSKLRVVVNSLLVSNIRKKTFLNSSSLIILVEASCGTTVHSVVMSMKNRHLQRVPVCPRLPNQLRYQHSKSKQE